MALPLKIEHRVGIQVPATVVWPIVADIAGWHTWNPLYPKASGVLGFEEVLTLEVAIPGEKPRTIKPVVVDWTPNEQVIWRLSLLGGMLRSTRYIEIEVLTETGCIFSNGEIFEGPLQGLISKKQRRAIKAGFAAMGEAVREKAEAAWQAQADVTT